MFERLEAEGNAREKIPGQTGRPVAEFSTPRVARIARGPLETLRDRDRAARSGAAGAEQPCWCGSGQKYKKCHLDEDARGAHIDGARAPAHGARCGQGWCRRAAPCRRHPAPRLRLERPARARKAGT